MMADIAANEYLEYGESRITVLSTTWSPIISRNSWGLDVRHEVGNNPLDSFWRKDGDTRCWAAGFENFAECRVCSICCVHSIALPANNSGKIRNVGMGTLTLNATASTICRKDARRSNEPTILRSTSIYLRYENLSNSHNFLTLRIQHLYAYINRFILFELFPTNSLHSAQRQHYVQNVS